MPDPLKPPPGFEPVEQQGDPVPPPGFQSKGISLQDTIAIPLKSTLGIKDVDVSTGAPFGLRASLSFAENDEEIGARFKEHFPKGKLVRVTLPQLGSRLVFVEDSSNPNEVPKTVDEVGVGFGDVADIAGALPETVGSIAPFLIPGVRESSILGQAIAAGAGAALGQLAEEGVEKAQGLQRQSNVEVLFDAAREGLISGTGAMVGGFVNKALNVGKGSGILKTSPATQETQRVLAQNPELEKFVMSSQLVPESKILDRVTKQALSTSRAGQEFLQAGEEATAKSLSAVAPDVAPTPIGQALRGEIKKVLGRGKAAALARVPRTSAERGGNAAIDGLKKEFVRNSAKIKNSLYDEVDRVAAAEQPEFDLSPVLDRVAQIRQSIANETAEGGIVGPGFRTELLNVMDDIQRIATVQSDYNAVKSLRTRLFSLTDNQPWQWDFNKLQAQRLWNDLSKVLKNPIGDAPGYKKAIEAANTFTRQRYEILNDGAVQNIIRSSKPFEIGRQLAQAGNVTENIQKSLMRFAPKKWQQVKESVQFQWLKSPKAIETMQKFKQAHPEGWKRIVSGSDEKLLFKVGRQLDMLHGSRAAKALENQTQAGLLVKKLIANQDVEGVIKLVASVGGRNSKGGKLLQAGILEHMFNESIEETARGTFKVNQRKFAKLFFEWDRNGILDNVLGPQVKGKLTGLKTFSRLWQLKVDPGVSLEAAQAISLLKKPSTFFSGAHVLTVNGLMARALTSPKVSRILVGNGSKPLNRTSLIAMSSALNQLLFDMDIDKGEEKEISPSNAQ